MVQTYGPTLFGKAAAELGAVKDGWNGFAVLHSAASRVGALDLGFVGEPAAIDVRVIHALTGGGLVPVIAPVVELMCRPGGRVAALNV